MFIRQGLAENYLQHCIGDSDVDHGKFFMLVSQKDSICYGFNNRVLRTSYHV